MVHLDDEHFPVFPFIVKIQNQYEHFDFGDFDTDKENTDEENTDKENTVKAGM